MAHDVVRVLGRVVLEGDRGGGTEEVPRGTTGVRGVPVGHSLEKWDGPPSPFLPTLKDTKRLLLWFRVSPFRWKGLGVSVFLLRLRWRPGTLGRFGGGIRKCGVP